MHVQFFISKIDFWTLHSLPCSCWNIVTCKERGFVLTTHTDMVVVYEIHLSKVEGLKRHLIYLHLKYWSGGGVPDPLTKG